MEAAKHLHTICVAVRDCTPQLRAPAPEPMVTVAVFTPNEAPVSVSSREPPESETTKKGERNERQ